MKRLSGQDVNSRVAEKVIMYHSCRHDSWEKCIEQGYFLHNRASEIFPNASPCLYLAQKREDCEGIYGDILLEVEFEPAHHITNYHTDCWQCRVYSPIPLDKVKVII